MHAATHYLAPHALHRIAREVPGYATMKLRNAFSAPVPLKRGKDAPRRVVIFPGLMARPTSMKRLMASLEAAGCEVHDWGMGRNLGFRPGMLEKLERRLRRLSADGTRLTLIGWSLGGLMARELAKCHPDWVERVVTLGSPFSGDIMRNNNAVHTYKLLAGHAPDEVPQAASLAQKPPVPTIAIWSRRDGIVAPGAACGQAGEADVQIEVACSHMEFSNCPETIRAIGAALGLKDARPSRRMFGKTATTG